MESAPPCSAICVLRVYIVLVLLHVSFLCRHFLHDRQLMRVLVCLLRAGVVSNNYSDASTQAVVRIVRTVVVGLAQQMNDSSIAEAAQRLAASALAAPAGQVGVIRIAQTLNANPRLAQLTAVNHCMVEAA